MKWFNIKRLLAAFGLVLGIGLAHVCSAQAGLPYKKGNRLNARDYWRSVQKYYKVSSREGTFRKLRVGPRKGRFRNRRTRSFRSLTASAQAAGELKVVRGKAKGFFWDRQEKQIRIAAFIDAADDHGIAIENLKPGDQVKVVAVSGVASFDDAKAKREKVGSIIGIAADAAKLAKPEYAKAIEQAEKSAKTLINLAIKAKRRDAYGRMMSKNEYARQEGGVLISMPVAQGPFYSSDSGGPFGLGGSTSAWIQTKGPRLDKYRPKAMKQLNSAFFPVRGNPSQMNRKVRANGTLFVTPWDWKFKDNAGMYKVELLITRGEPQKQPPVVNAKPRRRPGTRSTPDRFRNRGRFGRNRRQR